VQECGCYEHYVGGEEVGASEDDTIITRPMGNMSAPAGRIRPVVFSWYQGAVSVERRTAQLGFC
jgi:hypothetical protein